jgi:mannose-6-phosphate isomerase-like protein (cupin superfamily)
MIIKDLKNCNYALVQDKTILCEFLHPERESNQLEMDYSIAHAIIREGQSSTPHCLDHSSEVYFILEGRGRMYIDDDQQVITTGQAVYIPPGALQWIKNIGETDLKFLCIVSPPWRAENDHLQLKI